MNSVLLDTDSKRRDKLFIIAEIMEISKAGALKTQIMYRANLSFAQLGEYLKLLEKLRLLQKQAANGKEIYRATEKGLAFLQRHNEIMDLLNETEGVRLPPENLLRKN